MDDNKFENDIFDDTVVTDDVDDVTDDIIVDDSFIADDDLSENMFIDADDVLDDAEPLDLPVISTDINEMPEKSKKNGVKVFLAIICFLLAISIAAGAGYFVGSNKTKSSNGSVALAPKPDSDKLLSTEEVYNTVNPSVVGITIYNSEGIKGYASGVVYSEDGYIITNDHIYEEVKDAKFRIHDYQSKTYEARYIAGDTRSDLAVLKIDSDGFFPATFGNSDEINFGEDVVAVGRPSSPSDDSSITKGIVSYPKRRVTNSTNYSSKLIQTDSAINPGSSGGALVNMYGQVIGITSSKLVGSSYEGIGYAIPTVTVKKIVESLIKNGTVVDRGRLGFTYQEIDSLSAAENSVSYGLRIVSVTEDSDMLGKVTAGDVITAVNGQKVTTDDVLIDILESVIPGDTLTMDITTKGGATKQIKVKVLQDYGSSSYETTEEDIPLLPQN